jgi:hypothetical protein
MPAAPALQYGGASSVADHGTASEQRCTSAKVSFRRHRPARRTAATARPRRLQPSRNAAAEEWPSQFAAATWCQP